MTLEPTRRELLKWTGVGATGLAAATLTVPAAHAQPATPSAARVARRIPPYRVGQWLPSDQAVLDKWLADLIRRVDRAGSTKELHPSVLALKHVIESEADVYMWFHQMFTEVPDTKKFATNPAGGPQVRGYKHMLVLINEVLTTAPEFNETGLVGFPINAILDWSMGTQAGSAAFLDDRVNAAFKGILDAWGEFLTTPESRYVLNKNPRSGWFGKDAQEAMPGFDEEFICDPSAPYHGFTSWDDFFTRQFRPGQRPVASPQDPRVIVNACESAPYRIATDLKRLDKFWLKGQPYSLRHVFDNDPINEEFVGGTLYQAFLSALSYHRWHMPVDGTIRSVRIIDGSYYAENLAEGFDPAGPNESQGYISEVATRAVILIDADDPAIGLMAVVPIGMAEVSTCQVTAKVGQHLNKGEELGMFHFGGSTHLLIFRPETSLRFILHGQQPGLDSQNIPINAALARVL